MPQTESELLSTLTQRAFALANESVPLGFDIARIEPTLNKLPGGKVTGLEPLFISLWPAESFHTGTVELYGPDRINQEHDGLLPGSVAIRHGFLGIGGNGGNLFNYCIADKRVYFLESDYFSEDAVYARPWQRMDVSPENIKKAAAPESWDSLAAFFKWAISELRKLEAGDQNQA
jgi:hypothetical protein